MDAGPRTTHLLAPAFACAVSAGVHAVLVVPHLHESRLLAAAFAVSAIGLPVLAPEPEALDPVGVATQAVQLTGAVFAFLPTHREIPWQVS